MPLNLAVLIRVEPGVDLGGDLGGGWLRHCGGGGCGGGAAAAAAVLLL